MQEAGASSPLDSPMEGVVSGVDSSVDISTRVKLYLDKKRNDNGIENFVEPVIPNQGTYRAIKTQKINSMCVSNLNGKETTMCKNYGSFFNSQDGRISYTHTRHAFESSLNVSFSFDPATWQCQNCGDKPHSIWNGSGVFILSDQNFPPALPTFDGKCISVIRVENGSLHDLADTFLQVMAGMPVPVGTLILLSSASHLG